MGQFLVKSSEEFTQEAMERLDIEKFKSYVQEYAPAIDQTDLMNAIDMKLKDVGSKDRFRYFSRVDEVSSVLGPISRRNEMLYPTKGAPNVPFAYEAVYTRFSDQGIKDAKSFQADYLEKYGIQLPIFTYDPLNPTEPIQRVKDLAQLASKFVQLNDFVTSQTTEVELKNKIDELNAAEPVSAQLSVFDAVQLWTNKCIEDEDYTKLNEMENHDWLYVMFYTCQSNRKEKSLSHRVQSLMRIYGLHTDKKRKQHWESKGQSNIYIETLDHVLRSPRDRAQIPQVFLRQVQSLLDQDKILFGFTTGDQEQSAKKAQIRENLDLALQGDFRGG